MQRLLKLTFFLFFVTPSFQRVYSGGKEISKVVRETLDKLQGHVKSPGDSRALGTVSRPCLRSWRSYGINQLPDIRVVHSEASSRSEHSSDANSPLPCLGILCAGRKDCSGWHSLDQCSRILDWNVGCIRANHTMDAPDFYPIQASTALGHLP